MYRTTRSSRPVVQGSTSTSSSSSLPHLRTTRRNARPPSLLSSIHDSLDSDIDELQAPELSISHAVKSTRKSAVSKEGKGELRRGRGRPKRPSSPPLSSAGAKETPGRKLSLGASGGLRNVGGVAAGVQKQAKVRVGSGGKIGKNQIKAGRAQGKGQAKKQKKQLGAEKKGQSQLLARSLRGRNLRSSSAVPPLADESEDDLSAVSSPVRESLTPVAIAVAVAPPAKETKQLSSKKRSRSQSELNEQSKKRRKFKSSSIAPPAGDLPGPGTFGKVSLPLAIVIAPILAENREPEPFEETNAQKSQLRGKELTGRYSTTSASTPPPVLKVISFSGHIVESVALHTLPHLPQATGSLSPKLLALPPLKETPIPTPNPREILRSPQTVTPVPPPFPKTYLPPQPATPPHRVLERPPVSPITPPPIASILNTLKERVDTIIIEIHKSSKKRHQLEGDNRDTVSTSGGAPWSVDTPDTIISEVEGTKKRKRVTKAKKLDPSSQRVPRKPSEASSTTITSVKRPKKKQKREGIAVLETSNFGLDRTQAGLSTGIFKPKATALKPRKKYKVKPKCTVLQSIEERHDNEEESDRTKSFKSLHTSGWSAEIPTTARRTPFPTIHLIVSRNSKGESHLKVKRKPTRKEKGKEKETDLTQENMPMLESPLTASRRRSSHPRSYANAIGYTDANHISNSEKADREKALERNIDNVVFANVMFKSWYPSWYPTEIIGDKALSATVKPVGITVPALYVCKKCFGYSKIVEDWLKHCKICDKDVPGQLVYNHGQSAWSVWEVDGDIDTIFCQNLSLFAKLFLDNKSVFFDVSGFNYFLLVHTSGDLSNPTNQIVGFFSKEKMSWDNNNLACILIFPPWQRKGLGSILMGVSYEISRREEILGGPEKPISDLGKKGYRRFWGAEIARWLLECKETDKKKGKDIVTVEQISRETWIHGEDCLGVLREMGVAEKEKPSGKVTVERVVIDKERVREWVEKERLCLDRVVDLEGFVEGYGFKTVVDEETEEAEAED